MATEPKVLDGTTYDRDAIEGLRESAIEMRDAALKADAFDWAVSLSHIVAVLGFYRDELPVPSEQKGLTI